MGKSYKLFVIIAIFLYIDPVAVCSTEKVSLFVSILPQKYFVQQIGKDLVDVHVMVQPGANPATYEPRPRQMAALAKTKIYFAVGVPFENTWFPKLTATNPQMKLIQTDAGIEKLVMTAHQHESERHKKPAQKKDHNAHNGLDPHIWLSPPLVKIQARAILTALLEIDPTHARIYEANFKKFAARIGQLDADLKKIFVGKSGLQFMVFHPSWGYFAQAYGLRQVPIEIEGKDPKPAQLKELVEHARENKIKVIFVQPQFSIKSAKIVAREIGGQVVDADPLAYDWIVNLQEVAAKFQAALK